MKIENKSKENRKELNKLQKDLKIKNFSVLICPEVNSSVDQCIEGAIRLIKGTLSDKNDFRMSQDIRYKIEEDIEEVVDTDVF
jgi:hypothetical protein